MSFTIKVANSKILKGIVETLAGIVNETQFRANPHEFVVDAMDPGRVCMVRLAIKKQHFDEYKCVAKESKVGVNLEDLDKILKRSTANDSVELDFNAKEQKIKVKMKRDGSSRTRTFSLAAITTQIAEVPVDSLLEMEYASRWEMDPDFLSDAVKDAEIYSDALTVKMVEGKLLTFTSIGQIGEMTCELEVAELPEHTISGTDSGTFSLSFLKAILKIASITERLEMAVKTDHPLKLSIDLIEGGQVLYYLAPQVNDTNLEGIDDEALGEVEQ